MTLEEFLAEYANLRNKGWVVTQSTSYGSPVLTRLYKPGFSKSYFCPIAAVWAERTGCLNTAACFGVYGMDISNDLAHQIMNAADGVGEKELAGKLVW